ncbi:hypothetical protein ERO13_A03G164201v2 [Gossypium hirsutum]|uniref:Uncharacterized protein n=1 Tax=Gossypium darwinii TaxID=34276 RepID=A0A5D2H7G1_GOSDA|nr:hypothetical protein ERO13_A03G164201v2 [Gossypium hirsutum]TYH25840.1 hypothetical protein ES288_A03G202300v1 [Gossypium darwinii]
MGWSGRLRHLVVACWWGPANSYFNYCSARFWWVFRWLVMDEWRAHRFPNISSSSSSPEMIR